MLVVVLEEVYRYIGNQHLRGGTPLEKIELV